MNLTKLFNFRYLMQNIKKSKMTIALFMLIVPLMTSLMIISQGENIYNFMELSAINIFGMYIIPFIFSVCFFGYVFKKKSVDFMGSMPISRKTIFVTNTIGGIGLIIILQLITFLFTMLLGLIVDATIFTALTFDIFIYMTISYIFMFTIANLAMSVSGNVLTQIVVTLLVLCLIPVSYVFIELFNNSYDFAIVAGQKVLYMNKYHEFTGPMSFLRDNGYAYSVSSMIKMGVLSIIYFAIGAYAFTKRKMEIAEESFEKKSTHLIVKGLTLTPFVMILIAIIDSSNEELIPIILGIMGIYYFLYDLITNKKMKFKDNILAFCTSIVVLYGAFSLGIAIEDELDHRVEVDKITSVTLTNDFGIGYTFKNKEDIRKVINKVLINERNMYEVDYTWWDVAITTGSDIKAEKRRMFVDMDELNKLIPNASRKTTLGSKAVIDSQHLDLTSEEEKVLLEIIENEMKNNNSRMNDMLRRSKERDIPYTLYIYSYNNHSLINYQFPINLTKEMFDLLVKAFNRKAKEVVDEDDDFWWNNLARITNGKTSYILEEYTYDFDKVREIIINAVNSSYEEKVNPDDFIRVNGGNFVFFTSDTQGIMREISTFEKNEEYYKDYEKETYTSFPEATSNFVIE